jgi:hypothetical protein
MIIPNIWKVIKFMFQTTNQIRNVLFVDIVGRIYRTLVDET